MAHGPGPLRTPGPLAIAAAAACCVGALACGGEHGRNEQAGLLAEDGPRIQEIVRQDVDRVQAGVREAAGRLAPRFGIEDADRREAELRTALRATRQPPLGVDGLMATPISFVAAVGPTGEVLARDTDAERDRMTGMDMAEVAPIVQRALDTGRFGYALTELPALEEGVPPSVTVLFVAAVTHGGQRAGAVVAGMPLWMVSRQLTNQIQLEHREERHAGALYWTAILGGSAGARQVAGNFPSDLLELVPQGEDLRARLQESPGGFTGQDQQYGRWYGYLVLPLPTLGEGVVAVAFRSDPV
ncbi:MAG: hypothetical protein ACFCGT_19115 [Sandaracinaceae bacterium]